MSDPSKSCYMSITVGASENVNFAMHTLCGLLVLYGVFKEVYVARLPVGHTHIDIDGRHAIFAMHFNGTKDSAGRVVEGVMTPSDFDTQIKVPFKQDAVTVIRKHGLLSFADTVRGWLAISNYGTPSKMSRHATKQGCRDPEPHYMHYFKDPAEGDARLRYKFRENMSEWLPTLNNPPIKLLHAECVPVVLKLLQQSITVKDLDPWPQKVSIEEHILSNKTLTPVQVTEWQQWFIACPEQGDEIPSSDCFEWCIPRILKEKILFRKSKESSALPPQLTNLVSSLEMPFHQEVLVHSGYSKQALHRDRQEREDWNSRRKQAQAEQQMIEAITERRHSGRK